MITLPAPVRVVWQKIQGYALAHKAIATIIALVLLYGGWSLYGRLTAPSTATRYVTATAATGTVVATMSETGQVSASSNIDILAKSSGEVLSLPVVPGTHVDAGSALASIDPTTALQNVTSARQALQSAQIALAKLQEPAATSTRTGAENASAAAAAALVQTHQTGYNDISTAFLTLPNVITSLDTVLHGTTVPGRTSEQNENAYSDMVESLDPSVVQYRTAAESAYQKAYAAYTKALADFKATPRNASDTAIESLLTESYAAAADLSDALKASTNFLNFVNTTLTSHTLALPTTLAPHIATLTANTTTTNTSVAALSSDVANVTSGERAVAAAKASLDATIAGADPLDVQSSQLSLQMKQDALEIAQQALADTIVRAPFSGTVAKVNVQKYATIGSGTSVATLVSDNQSVDISVNEVDAAKLKVGEKATITFDALANISIAGTVATVNTIGTASSGVVSYAAMITFDTPNQDVKPGMSATVSIITGTATGITIPSAAVKGATGQSYVQVFNPPLANSATSPGATSTTPPVRTPVILGLSGDTEVIVERGLVAGDQVVTQTTAGATAATAASSAARNTSVFGGGSTRPSGGGAVLRGL